MKHLCDLEDVDFLQFIGTQESQYLAPLSTFRDGINEIFELGIKHYGDELPWKKTEELFRLRPNEVSIWCGINGHGKSLLTSQLIADLIQQGKRCLIASLEMPINRTAHRLLKQLSGTANPTEAFRNQILDWTDEKLWVYDQLDSVEHERIIGMCIYAFTELKIDHVVIDSLLKCGIATKDTEKMHRFVDKLCWVAKTHGGHIHIVHHIRKGEDENKIPNKFDLKGAGEIADLVDNIGIVWKNKKKIAQLQRGETVDKMIPDQVVVIEKQRHGEWEGKINLWFDQDTNQYKGSPDARPTVFNQGRNLEAVQSRA